MTLADSGRLELPLLSGGGCACCSVDAGPSSRTGTAAESPDLPFSSTFGVAGMTCSSCVRHVTGELAALGGVGDVQVDLEVGGVSTVTVHSTAPVDAAEVSAAVAEAGYEVVTR